MAKPQQPEVAGRTGPVPPENEPGHHPAEEQDKPDLDAFASKLGMHDAGDSGEAADVSGPVGTGATASSSATRRLSGRPLAFAVAAGLLMMRRIKRRRRRLAQSTADSTG